MFCLCERGDHTQSRFESKKGFFGNYRLEDSSARISPSDAQILQRWILGATVDHDEAVRTFATEMYLLGEMYSDLREEFEMHIFDCEQCAFDLWAAVTFLAHAKAILKRESELPFS